MKHKTKLWLLVASGLALLLVSTWLWRSFIHPERPILPPIPVEVTTVQKGILIRSLTAAGTLVSHQSITIRPEIDGVIKTLYFEDGQPVEAQERLIHLKDSTQQADLQEAQARLVLSKAEYERNEALLQSKAISQNDRDIAFSKFKVDEAQVAKAESELEKTLIVAPFSGIIGISKVDEGDFASSGQELVNLVKIDPLTVDFKIPEIYLNEIKLDQRVELSGQVLSESIKGKVIAIDPEIDPIAHSIYLTAEIPNTDLKLKPGLFVRVHLILEQRENVLFVPETALVPQQGKQFVYVVTDNKAILTEVKLGERQGTQVEVLEGLHIGDRIITAGQIKIHSGSLVTPLNDDTANSPGNSPARHPE